MNWIRVRTLFCLLAVATVAAVVIDTAHAQQPCCAHCGCAAKCQKVCRLVCETKEVTKVTYSCKCEDFCIPGPSCRVKDCCADCCGMLHKCFRWIPGNAEIQTKKVPVRHEEKIKKPSYKWVVEDLCPTCAAAQRYKQH